MNLMILPDQSATLQPLHIAKPQRETLYALSLHERQPVEEKLYASLLVGCGGFYSHTRSSPEDSSATDVRVEVSLWTE